MTGWIKRQGDAAIALAAVGGIISSIIIAFGGHIPPYTSYALGQDLQAKIKGLDAGQQTIRRENVQGVNSVKALVAFGQITMLYLRQCEAARARRFDEAGNLGAQIAPLLRDYQQWNGGVAYPDKPC